MSNPGPLTPRAKSLPPSHVEHTAYNVENIVLKPFPLETSASTTRTKIDRALFNMNSKIFFRRMTAVWSVKTQRKRISSHLKNESPTKPRYSINSSASKMCFVTTIFANILRIIIQNRFHLLLKVLKHSKFSEWCSLCSALCCRRLLLRCSR